MVEFCAGKKPKPKPAERLKPKPATPPRAGAGQGGKTSSRFIGVSWCSREKRWKAFCKDARGKQIPLGYHDNEEAAARAYNAAAKTHGRPLNPVDAGKT